MSEDKNQEMLEQIQAAEEREAAKSSKKAPKKSKEKPARNSDGHVLTEAEIKRQKVFEEKEQKILAQGYKREDILISVLTNSARGFPFLHTLSSIYYL